jgi:hypothetical protein
MKKTQLFLPIILFLLVSCAKPALNPTEFIQWCDDKEHELIQIYEQDDIQLTCQYMPEEYAALKQTNPNLIDENEVKATIDQVSDLHQFKLKFQKTTGNNFLKDNYTTAEEFNTRSIYLGYGIQPDLQLVSGSDTLICAMNHHERTYGNTPYETLLIAFPKSKNNTQSDLQLIFNDRVFGLGRVKFYFKKSTLESIPELVFE